MKKFPILLIVLLFSFSLHAQVNYTANDAGSVPVYTNSFLNGSNMGYYDSWDDETLSDIAAGNSAKNVKGAGVKSLHLPLPEDFLEQWGYNIRVQQFNHYASLGIQDNTVFLGLPVSAAHKDNNTYGGCTQPSQLFQNMYTPVWDGGANGTPVNDNNYFALYVYKTVMQYKQYTKFWEIINEPDFDGGAYGWRLPGDPGNWWDNNPSPCDLSNLKAPVFHYIHMLRIAYDVIKTIDPTAYVSVGGIGYPSFLDVLLRNTDNPLDGSITTDYPLKGGAYFDCLSFHYYPMYDLRYWDNTVGGFVYKRHSDAAADEYINRKNTLQNILNTYGYNGTTYPRKVFIATESNIPRKEFSDYIGTDEAQRNYVLKAMIESQVNDIKQLYIFTIGDSKDYASATDPHDVMGLYQPLAGIGPLTHNGQYLQQYNSMGIAYKTFSDILNGFKLDAARTADLSLPANVRGAAFKNALGDYVYALWAATNTDKSELNTALYTFPALLNVGPQVYQRDWNYSQSNSAPLISSVNVQLTATPSFFSSQLIVTALPDDSLRANNPVSYFKLKLYPNPANNKLTIKLSLKKKQAVSINIFDGSGQVLMQVANNKLFESGDTITDIALPANMSNGIYYCRLFTGNHQETIKFEVIR